MRPAWISLCLAAACAGDHPLSQEAWVPVTASADPLADARPVDATCLGGWWIEPPFVEVDTGACAWFSVSQPLPGRGPRLRGGLAWDDLVPAAVGGSGEGIAAVFVGGVEVFRHTQPIPASPGFVAIDVTLPSGARRGDDVVLHLHNHGVNQWRWLPLTVGR